MSVGAPSFKVRDLFNYRKLTADEQAFYNDNGYLVLTSVLTPRGLETLREESMAAWRAEKREFEPGKTWLQNSLLSDIHHYSALVRKYYFEGPLVDVMVQLIGHNIKAASSQLTFKMRGNTAPFGWHQDNGYGELDPYNTISTLTALDDADQENGCLWLIPGSHHHGQIRVEMTPEQKAAGKDIAVQADESRAVPMPLKAGDVLLFHCWMLHKSDGNFAKDRDRRIIFLRYADADAVEVYNDRRPRLGRLLRGTTRFADVETHESHF